MFPERGFLGGRDSCGINLCRDQIADGVGMHTHGHDAQDRRQAAIVGEEVQALGGNAELPSSHPAAYDLDNTFHNEAVFFEIPKIGHDCARFGIVLVSWDPYAIGVGCLQFQQDISLDFSIDRAFRHGEVSVGVVAPLTMTEGGGAGNGSAAGWSV
jgi:hypothetical protein